ncbi:MAG: hypothetical protein KKD18_06015 [Nanoarchaeota archaeon]|nr:hypothetical protein [Nanoarchaeota archaeon]MBU0977947.1 hypothetical protein [Nanoarchaeota archaeon]
MISKIMARQPEIPQGLRSAISYHFRTVMSDEERYRVVRDMFFRHANEAEQALEFGNWTEAASHYFVMERISQAAGKAQGQFPQIYRPEIQELREITNSVFTKLIIAA